ncbi:cytochrome P450 [Mycena pura]|uniref:Cytochrome P450 n=1 Tax=Mycena pura TaxID=153505 RepID=A0AAD6YG95_9AGAR|nr:cytochrome P450 [Mycena pura]
MSNPFERADFKTELLQKWPAVFTGALLVATLLSVLSNRRTKRFPPGPRGWPLIGNVLDIPSEYPWKVYRQWGREFNSDIISLKLPGPPLVVLNSATVADTLLIKRSAIYSNRPRMVMLNDLYVAIRADWNLALMPYGERFKGEWMSWHSARKLFNKHVDVPYCRPQAVEAVRKFLQDLLGAGETNHQSIIRLMTGRFILAAGYGIEVESADDPYIETSETFIKSISHATQRGAFLVDSFPIFKHVPIWFPGANFQRIAAKIRKLAHDARTLPFEFTEAQVSKGAAKRSFATRFLESARDDTSPQEVDDVRSIIGNMYIAYDSDIQTVLAMRTFVLAMSLYPEVQKKGQEAVDAALGGDRLPDFNDFGHIPYVDAIINETLRWQPPLPLSIPHSALEDDHYEGLFIPKGSIVVANICAILQDEKVYGPNTSDFRPERFMMADGTLNKSRSSEPAFGYGRRQCTGKVMAKELIWMAVTSLLSTFDIHSPKDKNGVSLKAGEVEYGPTGNLK